jgi:hypothetical protein
MKLPQLSMSARDRRALVVGVIVIGGGNGAVFGLPVLRQWEATQREAAASAAHDLTLAESARRALGAFRDSLRARQSRLAQLDRSLIEAPTAAEAGAALSSLAADIADSSSVRVTSIQIRVDTVVRNGFGVVSVRLIGVGDVLGVATLVRSIEDCPTLLSIREIAVTQPEPGAPENRPEALRLDLVIEALARVRPRGSP